MASTVPLGSQVVVNRTRQTPNLFGNKCQERFRRSLAGAQGAARIAQVAKHERMAEAILFATTAPNRRQIRF